MDVEIVKENRIEEFGRDREANEDCKKEKR